MRTRPIRFRMQPLSRYKTSRLWNINANIVFADIVSTAATALIIQALQPRLPTHLAIVTVTAIVDGAISLAIFAGLRTGIGVLVAYLTAVAIVRTIHSLYGRRSGLFH